MEYTPLYPTASQLSPGTNFGLVERDFEHVGFARRTAFVPLIALVRLNKKKPKLYHGHILVRSRAVPDLLSELRSANTIKKLENMLKSLHYASHLQDC